MQPYKSLLQKRVLVSLVILIVSCLGLLYAEEALSQQSPYPSRWVAGVDYFRGQFSVIFHDHVTQEDVDAFVKRYSQYELKQLGSLPPRWIIDLLSLNVSTFSFNDSLAPGVRYMAELVGKEEIVYSAAPSIILGPRSSVCFHHEQWHFENQYR